ncbi:MAG: ferrous iron transporter B [Planctomycetota bacterium]|nr:MAG: ferrous iron transporter B [Planctomycetota bacterium]
MAPPDRPRLRVALLGSPNSGKTTLFNALTGLRAKTGNYPGVTVDRRQGIAATAGGPVEVIDLPGTYSLQAISEDEAVSVRMLRGEIAGEERPDGVVVVADATTLQRSLPLLAEALAFDLPTCLVLTMVDELKARGGEIDLFALQRELGVKVLGVVGHKGLGVADLRDLLADPAAWPRPAAPPPAETQARFEWADRILAAATRAQPEDSALTRRLDSILLHPVGGGLVFLAFVALFFQSIFSWAAPAMDLLDGAVGALADWLAGVLPPGWAASLLADGVVRGVGAVLVFLPQIALLFALIFFFEACGYMARAAFLMDRLMGWVGLEGRCFIALLSSYACAVPGILATRTIPSPRDRLATILVAPLATCSARLPVYALLITAFVPAEPLFGPFDLRGAVLFGLYLLGAASALAFAALFKRGLLRGAALPFYLELPPYRFPSLKAVLIQVWLRVWMFLRRAGTIILLASVALWALLHFPAAAPAAGAGPAEAARTQIEQSWAAGIGRALEPALAPMGWDWRIGVGLVGSIAAREVIVTTMAQVYAWEDPAAGDANQDADGFAAFLRRPDPVTGEPPLTRASAIALLVFFVYALQCISTIAVIRREAGSWRWALFAVAYQTGFAWLAAFLTFRLLA